MKLLFYLLVNVSCASAVSRALLSFELYRIMMIVVKGIDALSQKQNLLYM
jgi:hypothetical protein